jgi:hypothetical protein
MKKQVVKRLAIKLMNKHNLLNEGWKIEIDQFSSIYGDGWDLAYCKYASKTIYVNSLFINVCDIKDTILHEIAHALVRRPFHDETWKAKCIEIGGSGKIYGELFPFTREAIIYGFGTNFEII